MIFLTAAVVAYPATDYIISDSIERSLPHNVRNPGVEDYFDQLLVIYDGPFAVDDIDIGALLSDPDKRVMMFTPPVDIAYANETITDVIISNTQKESALDVIKKWISGNSNMTVGELLDAIMEGGTQILTIEDLSNTSEVIIFQTIPYEEGILKTNAIEKAGEEFETITGRPPAFTIIHIERDEMSQSNNPVVVYTKPLEVPLLKLKMSIIMALIVTLPFLVYISGKEVVKYVDVKKLNLKEKMPFKMRWMVLISLIMFISFILGAIYSYFFMAPLFIQFLYISAAASGAQATYSIYEFVNFIAMMTLIFGVIFEFPIVTFLLNRAGLVQKRTLTKYRRHLYVMFFIVAAIITPPDVVSQIIVAIPMIIFYEISVIIVKIAGRRDPPIEKTLR
ncbi:MAG: twin-arginine translocase subunit TatC [Methanimicrococcus sp.]|nr:twin-arginine translocase subunit TatC [Methanimicrococcus sp.]